MSGQAEHDGAAGTLLVTGGCGFIGCNFVRAALRGGHRVVNLDKLTYAGRLENLRDIAKNPRYLFVHGDICDRALVERLFDEHAPNAVVHLAAETHVDRSIAGPDAFVRTNVDGTLAMLEGARRFWGALGESWRARFRFLHVSTDEVFGSLSPGAPPFTESSPYAPRSPYAASKAGADHLVRAYGTTYGLPVIVGNCSNNYGPYQLPEKLIPLMIRFALEGRDLPVYGDGQQVRDWLHVEDHCRALLLLLERGLPGETYCVGGENERTNFQTTQEICALLDELRPRSNRGSYAEQIQFVTDRPGHDRRYAVDAAKLRALGWRPSVGSLQAGLRMTVEWYLGHPEWMAEVSGEAYRGWIEENYNRRSR